MWKRGLRCTCLALTLLGSAPAQTQTATMGPQTSSYTGSTRGYYFTAPASFTITGVRVLRPSGATHPIQNFAIVRFDNQTPPPVFTGTTNAFTQLALELNRSQSTFYPVNVTISAGDVIGIYGNTATGPSASNGGNSYAGVVQQTTVIAGTTVNLFRTGMLFHLGSATSPQGMHDVWSENQFEITRIEFEYTPSPTGPSTFCTAGTSSNGCVPAISASAQPSIAGAQTCLISVGNVEGQKSGLIFYGIDNSAFTPLSWGTGSTSFLCVESPRQRMVAQLSGGTAGQCDGTLTQDFGAYLSANPASLGQPFAVGQKVFAQAWYRDPPTAKTTNLSNAVELTCVP